MRHFTPTDPAPRRLGFRMPAEWEPHAASWLSWPADDELWFGHLAGVRTEFSELVRTIARFEPVHLLVRDQESAADAQARLMGTEVQFHQIPLNDVWIRDNGPIFITAAGEKGRQLSLLNWRFNAWGQKFHWQLDDQIPDYVARHLQLDHWDRPEVFEGGALEVNGLGLGLTTRSCLLSPARNPELDEAGYAELLRETLGVDKLLWLDGGLENDHTDGHIDTICRFVKPRTVVTCVEADRSDPNQAVLAKNLADLHAMTDQAGQPLEIVELPLPANTLIGAEGRLPPTYANFYIGDGFVVVPQYDDPHDAQALAILRPLFPEREVIGLMSRQIIEGGGSFHCMTQQQPLGQPWRSSLNTVPL